MRNKMHLSKLFFITSFAAFLSVACKVTDTKIIGDYVDSQKGDSLQLFENKTFEYKEKLYYGDFGWNTGKWAINKNRISFFNVKPEPVVGYRLEKSIIDSIQQSLQIILLLNSPKRLITIKNASVSLRGNVLDTSSFTYNLNTLTINTNSFDSISIATFYFPPFPFKKSEFKENKQYQITIFQAERLFELDKYFFKYKRRSLLNIREKARFKKIKHIN